MHRIFFTLASLAAFVAFWTPGAAASTDVATPTGNIISSTNAATLGVPTGPVVDPVVIDDYGFADELVTPLADPVGPPGNMKTTFWGYQANASNSRLHSYTGYPNGPVVPGPVCVPTLSGGAGQTANGRGVAFDPLTGDLWISRLTGITFNGDSKLYLVQPPNIDPACREVTEIVVHSKPGRPIQDDFGALDVDEATKHIWAAGYKPIVSGGVEKSYFYLVNRNNGLVLQSCWVPFRDGGEGNDTLAVYRNPSLPGSSKYLITDAGEDMTFPPTYEIIDQSDCHNGNQVTPVAEVPKTVNATGIDVEWGGMLTSALDRFHNQGDYPFSANTVIGLSGEPFLLGIEDVSVCGFRAKFGGDGNDFCPYP